MLFRVIHGTGFADHRDLDLSRIVHLFFDPSADVAAEHLRLRFGNLLRLNHYADFSACLKCKAGFHAGELIGDIFKLFKTFEIQLCRFASGAGARGAESIAGIGKDRINRGSFHFFMVRCNRIDDVFGFIVLAENVRADCGMGAFDFMVDGFSDIVEKTDSCALSVRQARVPRRWCP